MPKRRADLSAPCSYVLSRGTWPAGPFRKRDRPDELLFYAKVVERLIDACEDKKRTEGMEVPAIAAAAELSNQTLYNILDGKSWGGLPTIYRLEATLNVPLWHHDHITR